MAANPFKPALIIVDFQEDFCPPNGALAVPSGRAIANLINSLLALPFALKIATRDWHPPAHVSFASNHPSAAPFTSRAAIHHPSDPSRSYTTTLWPVHCVQDTPGAQLVPELDLSRVHLVVDKGQDPRVEMYSAFHDPFRVSDSGLASKLKDHHITHVYVVGLAADFCVRATAQDAADQGYKTYIVEEATKPVMPDTWEQCKQGIMAGGVEIIPIHGDQVARVKAL
ncbi:nicotinamidase [Metarhizium album ARSEF 1941]|uniref:nicotinamidase n=1 Tax=Metarhizium album (strain ARSEF 1941) TaxID=1081103 RepID=A0A0B2WL67_METAS|nr:nicotinamidase [Metarhizium album ARSEF 1941]KHN94693.1 nicotinamidase [Metarhizium album ARSEF 1941]